MFDRPSLDTLVTRTRADVLTRLTTDDVLRHSDAEVLARAEAGAVHGLYGYLDYLALQLFPDTATDYLDRHGSLWGIVRKPAARATGAATLAVTPGTTVPAGTLLRDSNNAQYETTVEATAAGASLVVSLQAVDAGAAGNLASGAPLSLVSPVVGVQTAANADEISGGADRESDEVYRARILTRIRKTPQGGSSYDYEAWALQIEGVTRAWCYPEELGPGTVTVRFVRDDDAGPIPDSSEVATVATHINALRPVTSQVTVAAPIAVPIVFQIQALSPSTAAVQAAIESSLRALLRQESEPGEPLLISHIREAISLASDEYDHVLVSPSANVTQTTGHMATFGSITWL